MHELTLDAVAALTTLRGERDRSPGNASVNAVLGRLARNVGASSTDDGALPVELAGIAPDLRPLLAAAEDHLERHWARHVIDAPSPWPALERFPYLDGYRALCEREDRLLRAHDPHPDLLVNVGSGPLPISAALLGRSLGCPVLCVERDRSAAALGASLLRALSVEATTVVRDGAERARRRGRAVALVAALVPARGRVLTALLDSGVTTVAVRSAVGLRSLLYPPFGWDVPDADLVGSSGVVPGIINTTLAFRSGRSSPIRREPVGGRGP